MVDRIDAVMEMDTINCLRDNTVRENGVIFGSVGKLYTVSQRQESGESCEEK